MGSFAVKLHGGGSIVSGWCDNDDPDALPVGDYLQVLDKGGAEIFYLETADLVADPVKARQHLTDFLMACSRASK